MVEKGLSHFRENTTQAESSAERERETERWGTNHQLWIDGEAYMSTCLSLQPVLRLGKRAEGSWLASGEPWLGGKTQEHLHMCRGRSICSRWPPRRVCWVPLTVAGETIISRQIPGAVWIGGGVEHHTSVWKGAVMSGLCASSSQGKFPSCTQLPTHAYTYK